MTNPLVRVIVAIVALIALFGVAYTIAAYFNGMDLAGGAVWASILMVIYGPPVLLFSGIIALMFRGKRLRICASAAATAIIAVGSFLLATNHAPASIAVLVGGGTTLLLAMLPARAAGRL